MALLVRPINLSSLRGNQLELLLNRSHLIITATSASGRQVLDTSLTSLTRPRTVEVLMSLKPRLQEQCTVFPLTLPEPRLKTSVATSMRREPRPTKHSILMQRQARTTGTCMLLAQRKTTSPATSASGRQGHLDFYISPSLLVIIQSILTGTVPITAMFRHCSFALASRTLLETQRRQF